MAQLELRTRQVGPWSMNTYALVCPETGESVLIDPGDDPDELSEMLAGSRPVAIVLTHTHGDHIGALDAMRERLDVPVFAYDGPHFADIDIAVDQPIRDGATVPVGSYALRAQRVPGHVVDHLCFHLVNDHRVIVGDTLFDGGPGRTWNEEQFQETLVTLRDIVLHWPDETVCFPGHGPSFRLGDRRDQIEAFVAKDHGDFFGDAVWEM